MTLLCSKAAKKNSAQNSEKNFEKKWKGKKLAFLKIFSKIREKIEILFWSRADPPRSNQCQISFFFKKKFFPFGKFFWNFWQNFGIFLFLKNFLANFFCRKNFSLFSKFFPFQTDSYYGVINKIGCNLRILLAKNGFSDFLKKALAQREKIVMTPTFGCIYLIFL